MHSQDWTCAILSVQNITCPVYDLDLNVKFEGSYFTADRLGKYDSHLLFRFLEFVIFTKIY